MRTTAAISTTAMTVTVLVLTSFLLGQTTFFSSLLVSLKYFAMPLKKFLTLPKTEVFFF